MPNVFSVGQVNAYIRKMFTQDYMLRRIYIKGEVSNCKYHPSGHIYFSLKDETGTISCVMFASARKGLAFSMKNGQQVVALGNVSVYERDGRYQLYAEEIILDGAGLLWEKFERLKNELEEMGMFAEEYKQPIPKHVKRLGIVTASTGAAIRDIMNISKRRNPGIQLILYPALVQGEGAVASIVKGIEVLEQYGVDAMIVGRGGGSIEDLWAFNEEAVARAIFQCRTPVISAVGHETDTTISDFVADLRAPTPSAAAELAVEDIMTTQEELVRYQYSLNRAMRIRIGQEREHLERQKKLLLMLSPENQIREKRMWLAGLQEKLQKLSENRLNDKKHQLNLYVEQLKGLSPLEKLSQGYSYTVNRKDEKIKSVAQVRKGEHIQIYVTDGRIHAVVDDTESMKTGGV